MGFFASSGILNRRGFFSAPVSAAPPGPSGISVADAATIVINGNGINSGTYTRIAQGTKVADSFDSEGGGPETYSLTTGYLYRRPNILAYFASYEIIFLLPPGSIVTGDVGSSNPGIAICGTPYNTWTIIYPYYDDGNWLADVKSTNPSSDPTTIPTTGWSPSITITAA